MSYGDILDVKNKKYDVIVDTTGNSSVVNNCLDLIAPGGKLIVFGVGKESDLIAINFHDVWKKEIHVIGSRSTNHCHKKAIKFVKKNRVDSSRMITHRLCLKDLKEIHKISAEENYIKGVICKK